MKKNYDFSKAVKNPYVKRSRRKVTIQVDEETIGFFQKKAKELSLPYQTLINLYLRDCAVSKKRLRTTTRTPKDLAA